MPKNLIPIQVPEWQLQPLSEGRASLILSPITPQPRKSSGDYWVLESLPIDLFWLATESPGFRVLNKCPYKPDSILYVQEEWAEKFFDGIQVVSKLRTKSWAKNVYDPFEVDQLNWQPANTMPPAAAKIWLKVSSVTGVQFGQLTGDDERAMGWQNDVPMPVEFSDDDWVRVLGVRAISPF